MSILITAFDPFDDDQNSSEIVLRSLQADLPKGLRKLGIEIHFSVLPCARVELVQQSLGSRVLSLFERFTPELCILLGQAASRQKIALERVALNLCNQEYGQCSYQARTICLKGAPAYFTNFPRLEAFYESLGQENSEVEISNHAGIYLCNEVYYEALRYVNAEREDVSVLFVHIPLLEEQSRTRNSDLDRISLEKVRQVLTQLIQWKCHQE